MREFRPYGSVRGALSNERPYRDLYLSPIRSAVALFKFAPPLRLPSPRPREP